ncbi:MAG: FAD/NAD(P)-binding oxidoreductase, partial [Flavobacteriales bacterium]|nr:FAD/NAD(P)-binding oxidoreductase [Flavobacteriales bacterium]
GVSGITAARHIRKRSNHRITVISSETDHFYSRTALMYIYMGHMKYEHTKPYEDWFWEKNRIELIRARVEKVHPMSNSIELENGETMLYDELILATGSIPNRFGWPGQDLLGVQGLYSYQDLELMERNTQEIKSAVVVGGGLIGTEMAEMLRSRGIQVTFLVREDYFFDILLPKEESVLLGNHVREHGVNLLLSTELKEILSDNNGRVRGVETTNSEMIECQFVGLTVGVHPNIQFLQDSGIELDKGMLVDRYLRTNFKNVYALGDCAQQRNPSVGRRPIEQVWYTGKMMGETVAATICDADTQYDPGVWFNSAKFFDIEYQTYGWVYPQLRENEESIFWDAKDGRRCLRIIYDKQTGVVLGFNALGVRLRHKVCNDWIKNGTHIEEVVQNLGKANFDPEFFSKFEKEVQQTFQNLT